MAEENIPLEDIIYREAGHSVMAYLLLKSFTSKYVPLDRSLILPPFEKVSITPPFKVWGKLTGSLGSLITVAQVLVAGYLAPKIHCSNNVEEIDFNHPLIIVAKRLLSSYMGEYGDEDYEKRQAQAHQLLEKILDYVHNQLNRFWASVDALAETMKARETLTEDEAFAIIESKISQEQWVQVAPILEKERIRREQVAKQIMDSVENAQRKKNDSK